MEQWLVQYQVWCRIGCFIVALCILAILETYYAWRPWVTSRKGRFARHLSLGCLSQLLIRLLYPLFAITVAMQVEQKGFGILHQPAIPYALCVVLGVIGLDLTMYLQHRLFHKYQWLWRIHRVHHMDKAVDVSTGIRFHPIEEIITMGVKLMGIAFLGALPLSVFIFEILYSVVILFAHINIQFHFKTEVFLRRLIVTPGMHRLHHSVHPQETNSNYGFIFSWWDKLLSTYTFVSVSGERKLVFGLEEYQDPLYQTLENMLLIPFNPKTLRIKPQKRRKLKFNI